MVTTIGEGRLNSSFSLQEKTSNTTEKQVIPLLYKTFYMSDLIIVGEKKENGNYVIILNYRGNFKQILMKLEY